MYIALGHFAADLVIVMCSVAQRARERGIFQQRAKRSIKNLNLPRIRHAIFLKSEIIALWQLFELESMEFPLPRRPFNS